MPYAIDPFLYGWYVGCFNLLVIMNNVAMNILIQISLWDPAFNFGTLYPEVDHMAILFLVSVVEVSQNYCRVAILYISNRGSTQGLQFYVLANTYYFLLFSLIFVSE